MVTSGRGLAESGVAGWVGVWGGAPDGGGVEWGVGRREAMMPCEVVDTITGTCQIPSKLGTRPHLFLAPLVQHEYLFFD